VVRQYSSGTIYANCKQLKTAQRPCSMSSLSSKEYDFQHDLTPNIRRRGPDSNRRGRRTATGLHFHVPLSGTQGVRFDFPTIESAQ
jgi:hypothetical protein